MQQGMTRNHYIPAASACFDKVEKDDVLGHLGDDIIALVMDSNKSTIGLCPDSVKDCCIWPSFPGTKPSQGAICINWVVSPSFCYEVNIEIVSKHGRTV